MRDKPPGIGGSGCQSTADAKPRWMSPRRVNQNTRASNEDNADVAIVV